jgi:hypothetical protein
MKGIFCGNLVLVADKLHFNLSYEAGFSWKMLFNLLVPSKLRSIHFVSSIGENLETTTFP